MITASLIPGQDPRLVQIVIDETPVGESWRLVGRTVSVYPGLAPGSGLAPGEGLAPADTVTTPGAYEWLVPGGFGIGDGQQLTLADNRAPGNSSVVYVLVSESGEEASDALSVRFPADRDIVLQSPDGLRMFAGKLMLGSTDIDFPVRVNAFQVPGRRRPVIRYDVLGDVVSAFTVLVPIEEKTPFRDVLGPGGPVVYRLGEDVLDIDRVAVVQVTGVTSKRISRELGMREWVISYLLVDDPYINTRLGAFTWLDFDDAFTGRPWADFAAAFDTLDWDAFDRADWTVV